MTTTAGPEGDGVGDSEDVGVIEGSGVGVGGVGVRVDVDVGVEIGVVGVGSVVGVGDDDRVGDGGKFETGTIAGTNEVFGIGLFDGDTTGEIMVTLASGVFVTNSFGDTIKFVTFGLGVTILSPIFEARLTAVSVFVSLKIADVAITPDKRTKKTTPCQLLK